MLNDNPTVASSVLVRDGVTVKILWLMLMVCAYLFTTNAWKGFIWPVVRDGKVSI